MITSVYKGICIDGTTRAVTVEAGRIKSVEVIEKTGGLPRLLPVLVDLQQNGALGHAFNNIGSEAGEKELRLIASHLLKNGVGRVLATFTTAPYERLMTAAGTLQGILDRNPDLNSLFCGIFHEGVFISPEPGWRGGHDPDFIMPPDFERFQLLHERSGGRVRVVNIAPETDGTLPFIARVAEAGIKIALGHCNPGSDTVRAAIDAGASIVTHFGNGAATQIHRFNNPFWAFLDAPELSLGLVGDGFHLPPELVRIALKVKGMDNCFMVSDANIYSGCAPGHYQRIGGLDCVIEENGFIHVDGQEVLAGAWFQQNRSVEFLTERAGLDFECAWTLCSTVPARIAGIELPLLRPGDEATFVIKTDKKITTVFQGKTYEHP